jgi:predicted DNA-binding antitoxin AbrB/MazE fold protein
MITIDAMYEDGVLKPSEPLPLREHEKVRITVVPSEDTAVASPATSHPATSEPSLGERIAARVRALPADTLDGLPDDLAAQHDHYLYGTPKR